MTKETDMQDQQHPLPTKTDKPELSYFGMQSSWGITKHMGGLDATFELAGLCNIQRLVFPREQYVLVVGCGSGFSPCAMAKKYDCKVMGVDLSDKMVAWSRKRARRDALEARVEFRVADAQDLPFEDGLFDAVVCESVTAFVGDKPKALSEYARVTKPGGYVGMNECTWVKASPPQALVDYVYRTMEKAIFLEPEGWKTLMIGCGLKDVTAKTSKVNMISQWWDEMRQLSSSDLAEMAKAWKQFFSMFLQNPEFRKYAREITPSRRIIRSLFSYLGYGLFVGRK